MVKQGDISAVAVIQGLYRVADIIADRAYVAWVKNREKPSKATRQFIRPVESVYRTRVYLIEPNRSEFVSN